MTRRLRAAADTVMVRDARADRDAGAHRAVPALAIDLWHVLAFFGTRPKK
jgi:hypothetical protein